VEDPVFKKPISILKTGIRESDLGEINDHNPDFYA
jgi:hypothetical protein